MKPVEKAYRIDLNKISDPYIHSDIYCYAESRNKAKYKLLHEAQMLDLHTYLEEEITYKNIPVIRAKDFDKFLFEYQYLTKDIIEELLEERKRQSKLNDILNDNCISFCYIVKRGSYYCSNWAGYTSFKTRAGIYKKDEAVSHARNVREIDIKPINSREHNEEILKEIDRLKRKIIL